MKEAEVGLPTTFPDYEYGNRVRWFMVALVVYIFLWKLNYMVNASCLVCLDKLISSSENLWSCTSCFEYIIFCLCLQPGIERILISFMILAHKCFSFLVVTIALIIIPLSWLFDDMMNLPFSTTHSWFIGWEMIGEQNWKC